VLPRRVKEADCHDIPDPNPPSAPHPSARLGVTVSLPLLDAMIPGLRAGIQPAPRLGFVYLPHGAIMDQWDGPPPGTSWASSPAFAGSTWRSFMSPVSSLLRNPGDTFETSSESGSPDLICSCSFKGLGVALGLLPYALGFEVSKLWCVASTGTCAPLRFPSAGAGLFFSTC